MTSLADGGELLLARGWLAPDEARTAMEALSRDVPWAQKPIVMMGKQILQPRLVAWYGDHSYTYSGVENVPLPWTSLLSSLRDRVASFGGAPFNSVLLNLYRDGDDSMGFHADKEKELGVNPVIASLSLGATRRFVMRHASAPRIELDLEGGSLLLMRGTAQHFWRHGVPRTRLAVGPRINLTFRLIRPSAPPSSASHRGS